MLALISAIAARPAAASPLLQSAPGARPAGQRQGGQVEDPAQRILVTDEDARQTRERFKEVLNRYPPTLGRVLKLDPSLLGNQAYLAPYPGLQAFMKQHPEIAYNAGFFLEHVRINTEYYSPPDERTQALRMWNDVLGGLMFFLVFLVVTGTLVWLVRTLINYRRWHRLSKVQTEAHTKLLDRFASNEDLIAYVQTPAGRRFLESAPITIDTEPRAMSAPFTRILWSVQAGVVLTAAGLGLQFVSRRVMEEVAQMLFVIGVLVLSLGLGFIVSAAVAYVLSSRLGLFERRGEAAQG
jgi:hypothetical protein